MRLRMFSAIRFRGYSALLLLRQVKQCAILHSRTFFLGKNRVSNVTKAPKLDAVSNQLPDTFSSRPTATWSAHINIPNLNPPREAITDRDEFEEFAMDTYEWISMVRMQSPQLQVASNVDAYVSSYEVPCRDDAVETALACKVSWHGFLSPAWVHDTLMQLFQAVPSTSWLAFTSGTIARGCGTEDSDVTILRPPAAAGEYVVWEIRDINSD